MRSENMRSVKELGEYAMQEYVLNPEMGSPTEAEAIRDILTDLLHLGDEWGVCVREQLHGAEEVYNQEIDLELQAKTGVND